MSQAVADSLDVALAHHRAGNLPLAEEQYRHLLAQNPNDAAAAHYLGALCLQVGRAREAVELISKAILVDPANPDFYSHLGAAYGALGENEAAITSLRRAVALAPGSAHAHYNLGTALRNSGRLEEAATTFRHALSANSNSPETHYNLANTLRELNRPAEAEAAYREAIRLRPNYIRAMINLGNVLRDSDRLAEAVEVLRGAVAVDASYANAHLNLGTVLRDSGSYEEALQHLRQAVTLEPTSAEAHNNLGTVLQALTDFGAAEEYYETAVRLNPELPDAHFSRATSRLRAGDLAAGFAEFEWRWKCKSFSTRRFAEPRWDGAPLAGKTILLHAEQGLGDTLHFVRYATRAKERGATVVAEVQPQLLPILAGLAGVDRFVPAGSPPGPFDVHCPLMSLPGVLGLSMEQLWTGPYLSADPARVVAWRERLAEHRGFRVGICWQGNRKHLFDAQRSFALVQLEPLVEVANIKLISLQQGAGTEQMATSPFEVIDLGDKLDADGAFLDAAAVIKSLDLVITADTALAHLAGGLGAPVWLALSAHGDWRWFEDRDTSPWYPTMRLFRQPHLGEWNDVFQAMARALGRLVVEGG